MRLRPYFLAILGRIGDAVLDCVETFLIVNFFAILETCPKIHVPKERPKMLIASSVRPAPMRQQATDDLAMTHVKG